MSDRSKRKKKKKNVPLNDFVKNFLQGFAKTITWLTCQVGPHPLTINFVT